jgi:hypothetical protein
MLLALLRWIFFALCGLIGLAVVYFVSLEAVTYAAPKNVCRCVSSGGT